MAEQPITKRMSVAEMRKIVEGGSTVLHEGRMIRDVRDLPSDADNAVTVEEKTAALNDLNKEISERVAARDKLVGEIKTMKAEQGSKKAPPQGADADVPPNGGQGGGAPPAKK